MFGTEHCRYSGSVSKSSLEYFWWTIKQDGGTRSPKSRLKTYRRCWKECCSSTDLRKNDENLKKRNSEADG